MKALTGTAVTDGLALRPSPPTTDKKEDKTRARNVGKYSKIPASNCAVILVFVSSWLPARGHIGRYAGISNPVITSSAGGAKDCSDHRFRAPPAYTV